jgi:hypothetical protein
MTSACVTRCQPSPMPRSLCVCGCKGKLHGIAAAQLRLFTPLDTPPEAEVEQLALELGAGTDGRDREGEDEQASTQDPKPNIGATS